MSAFAKLIGLDTETADEEDEGTEDSRIQKLTDIIFKEKKKSWIQTKFHWLDDRVLKPCFGGNLKKKKEHEKERKNHEERRTQFMKIQAMKSQRSIEKKVDNMYTNKLSENDNDTSVGRSTNFDAKNNLAMGTKLDMIKEDVEDDN